MVEHCKTEQHQDAIITFICRDGSKLTSSQHEKGSGIDVDTLSHTTVQLQEVCETIDILANGIQTLDEDAQRLSNESLQLQNAIEELAKEYATLKLSIQEQRTY
jgi:FtsZ-binding cell division protein ZapB